MRVLFDESMPRPFARELSSTGHEIRTVRQLRWMGTDNGELLRRAVAAGFDALVTMDRNLEYQQNVANAEIGVVVLRAPSNRIDDLLPLVAAIRDALVNLRPGQVIHIGPERSGRRSRRS